MNPKKVFTMLILCCGLAATPAIAQDQSSASCVLAKYTGMTSDLIYRNYSLIGGMPDMASMGFELSCSVYKFDISQFTEPVESAYLQVEKISGNMSPITATNPLVVSAMSLNSDIESLSSVDSSLLGQTLDSVTFGNNGLYDFDITNLVNSWISGADNNGLALVTSASGFASEDAVGYVTLAGIDGSSYGTPSGSSPVIIATVPEPATLGMLALGSVAMLRRRKKADNDA